MAVDEKYRAVRCASSVDQPSPGAGVGPAGADHGGHRAISFHAVLNSDGLPLALILIVTGSLILWGQRAKYAALFEVGTPAAQTRAIPVTP